MPNSTEPLAERRRERPELPGYWRTAMKRAWDTFSLHTGVAGLILPILLGGFGYIVGVRAETVGALKGMIGGVACAVTYYAIILFVVTPRQLWNEAQGKIRPVFAFGSKAHSPIYWRATSYGDEKLHKQHQTLRIEVCNTGVTAIPETRVRLVNIAPLPDNAGNLPFTLKRHDAKQGDPPEFILPSGTAVPVNVFLYRYFDKLYICDDRPECYPDGTPIDFGNYAVSIEVTGRDVAPTLGKFLVKGGENRRYKHGPDEGDLTLVLIDGPCVS